MKSCLQAISKTRFKVSSIHAWSDSTITLAWTSGEPRRWNIFVSNHVSDIIDVISPSDWKHVPTEFSPADLASRSTSVLSLMESSLRWSGPEWLRKPVAFWPHKNVSIMRTKLEGKKTASVNAMQVRNCLLKFQRFSSAKRLIRTWAFVNRAPQLMKRSKRAQCGPLTAPEIQGAHFEIQRDVQEESFDQEFRDIVSNGQVQKSSRLRNLTPIVNDQGLLRVGGRLSQSEIPEDKKFPILLPKRHYFTSLIIRQSHEGNFHCGTQQTLCAIQQQYCIPAGRSKVKQYRRQCVKCQRFSVKATVQQMGDLPEERITPSRPFTHTGLDFAGPLTIRHGPEDVRKAYVALFVCCATKVIHLDLVSDLSFQGSMFVCNSTIYKSYRTSKGHI